MDLKTGLIQSRRELDPEETLEENSPGWSVKRQQMKDRREAKGQDRC